MIGILIFWLIFAIVVGVAADARGRNGVLWFVLAAIISPVLALILLLVQPDLKQSASGMLAAAAFEPAGVLGGIPYRVADDGSIHPIMQRATLRFSDFHRFTPALDPNSPPGAQPMPPPPPNTSSSHNPYNEASPDGQTWARGIAARKAAEGRQ